MCSSQGNHTLNESFGIHLPASGSSQAGLEEPVDLGVLRRLTDAHCHPSDDREYSGPSFLKSLGLGKVCAMSTGLDNQHLVEEMHNADPQRVIPFFGIHPWFVHTLSLSDTLPSKEDHYSQLFPTYDSLPSALPLLPPVTLLSDYLSSLSDALDSNPAAKVGEVGLDKSFHIPLSDKTLPRLNTPINHQVTALERIAEIAVRKQRNMSVHSVRSSGETVAWLDRMKKGNFAEEWSKVNICLHSFGGSPESISKVQKDHHNVYFSFAEIVSGRSPKYHDLIRAVADDRILVESDGPERYLDKWIWKSFLGIRDAKGWTTEQCIDQLERNWENFCLTPEPPAPKLSKKERRANKSDSRGGVE
ncbi:Metallo-dependent hydrolase [Meredithblackwellia eburnea MCA 4105]